MTPSVEITLPVEMTPHARAYGDPRFANGYGMPPSTRSTAPVVKLDASLAK